MKLSKNADRQGFFILLYCARCVFMQRVFYYRSGDCIMFKSLIGDREFYRRLFAVMVPVLIQNVITNFVSLLDNIMVGQIGTEPMSAVAIINQLIFVFNLCVFGGTAGAGILAAQFYGKGDHEGVRDTFRMKLMISAVTVAAALGIFLTMGDTLIRLFLHEGNEGLDLELTFVYARDYLSIMLWQLAPFAILSVYAITLRETGEPVLPMKASVTAVFVNLAFNYILIFGKFGAPALGVKGAAIATVIARFVELFIVVIWTHTHQSRALFIAGAYRSMRVPLPIVRQVLMMGAPLLINELLWSSGMTTLNQSYSLRGLEVVSAMNISSMASNLFNCAFLAMGSTVAIIVGQLLGSGDLERAVDEDNKLIAFAVGLCVVVGAVMALVSPFIPRIYNTTDTVRRIAVQLLLVTSVMMPLNAFNNCCYFTLRSGGKTLITLIFDSAFVWLVCIPVAFVLSRFTDMYILHMFIVVQALELIKASIGFYMVKKKMWVTNLVK